MQHFYWNCSFIKICPHNNGKKAILPKETNLPLLVWMSYKYQNRDQNNTVETLVSGTALNESYSLTTLLKMQLIQTHQHRRYLSFVSTSLVQSSNRIAYPTSSPSLTFISSETRLATDIAATLLGWVHPIMPYLVYPSSWRNWIQKIHPAYEYSWTINSKF